MSLGICMQAPAARLSRVAQPAPTERQPLSLSYSTGATQARPPEEEASHGRAAIVAAAAWRCRPMVATGPAALVHDAKPVCQAWYMYVSMCARLCTSGCPEGRAGPPRSARHAGSCQPAAPKR